MSDARFKLQHFVVRELLEISFGQIRFLQATGEQS